MVKAKKPTKNEHSPLQTEKQGSAEYQRADYFENGIGTTVDKLRSIMRFTSRQELAKMLAYRDLFEQTKGIAGHIADCGVFFGQGLMTYANLSAALEPINYQCKIIGFDTFEGDTGDSAVDHRAGYVNRKEYTYNANNYSDIQNAIRLFDMDRMLSHLPKIELVKGDLCKTAPEFVKNREEVLFRIVHLSVNLYKPTKATIDAFYPRIPSGGIIAVNGVNYTIGATKALLDSLKGFGITNPNIRVVDTCPNITYFVKD